jgi:flagellar hook-basal body complex protein FliE
MSDINRVLAARDAVLQHNATLRSIAPSGGANSATASAFAARLDTALTALPAPSPPTGVQPVEPTGFANTVQNALVKVNETLEREDVATEAYERGETTDVAAVVLQQQRASVEFEATLQVRNKLLAAYRDIMNMPI